METNKEAVVRLTREQAQMCRDRQDIERQIKKLLAERNAIDFKIQEVLRTKQAILGVYRHQRVVELQDWSRITLNVGLLKREHPEVAAAYAQKNEGQRLHYLAS